MRWNLPLVAFALLAGPGIYVLLSILQPSKLSVVSIVLGLGLLTLVAWGARSMFRLLFPCRLR
jgi:hypothetical protein